jgi:hypothetical protein
MAGEVSAKINPPSYQQTPADKTAKCNPPTADKNCGIPSRKGCQTAKGWILDKYISICVYTYGVLQRSRFKESSAFIGVVWTKTAFSVQRLFSIAD